MNRCTALPANPLAALALTLATGLLAVLATLPVSSAHAQATAATPAVRQFPANALRGTLVVVAPPEIRIDSKAERLSPGSRIRGMDGMLVMSGAIVGRSLVVNYTRESNGMVHDVWILTDAEIAEKRPHATPPRNFIFGSEGDAPARDDGRTPYNQLPGYGTTTR
ncbi:hypothetical protein ACO2Q9_13925 [Variovorax sp. VNK109]|jgi:hypothetical protein|uniref:hypothetical protein n=1 Tax=Variovorax sp. VNK109 TaxID=3400919 RepID=UPI003BFE6E57